MNTSNPATTESGQPPLIKEEALDGVFSVSSPHTLAAVDGFVTKRAFLLGLLLSVIAAAVNCRVQATSSVHFLGGVQMPFGAVFGLFALIVIVNPLLSGLSRLVAQSRLAPLTAVELLTTYSMLLMATLVSTLGGGNFFLTTGAALFYYSSRENRWADLFYRHVPSWFAPGWDGHMFRKEVIEPLYLGGLSPTQIPWHAWTAMLLGWTIFLLFMQATLFFMALLLRRQWIENEALAFPLVQLPLQMVEVDEAGAYPPSRVFWANQTMWLGFALAFIVHFLRGMNNYYPDWPVMNSIQGNPVLISFSDAPWDALGSIRLEIFLGGIGLAYLLTRDTVFSFWFFYFFVKGQYLLATQAGLPPASFGQSIYNSGLNMTLFQDAGAWLMMALLLLWTARHHLYGVLKAALDGAQGYEGEPFAPRFAIAGLILSFGGLLGWSWFAGISLFVAFMTFAIFLLMSLVIARLVVEGGFLFPQITFSIPDWLTSGLLGTSTIGTANLAKIAFLQPVLISDMRTNTLPAFLHVMKIAHTHNLQTSQLRRLLGASLVAIVASTAITAVVTLVTLYGQGGLTSYTFFTVSAPRLPFRGIAAIISQQPGPNLSAWGWMTFGAALVWSMMWMRNRFLWFPLHPVGYLLASGSAMSRLWLSFFLGWAAKVAIMKFGGVDSYVRVRPFMIGLILGNAAAMVFWMLTGFYLGTQIPYWPA